MNQLEEIKLRLIWLSCKDIRLLNKSDNKILLKKAWANIKTELRHYFQSYETSLGTITECFKKISFTIDPKLPAGYDAKKDILILNLWNLFFAVVENPFTNKDCVISSPVWKLGGELIHEYDHYQFSEENGIIGISEESRKKFDEKTAAQREKRALLRQIKFFEHSKKFVPFTTRMIFIRVTKWSDNGSIGNKKPVLKKYLAPRKVLVASINDAICQLSAVIGDISAGKNYDELSDKESFEISERFVKALSLPIKFDIKEKNYPMIELKM